MVWYINNITEYFNAASTFTSLDIIIVLIISTFLCILAALTYRSIHDGISYSQSFVHISIIFGVLVSMIMLIIGSNIARAFTLVGALSIIRFRNAIKETRDVGFIFFMMSIGMAVGTRFYLLAILMTLFVCLLLLVLSRINFAAPKGVDEVLTLVSRTQKESEFSKKLQPHCKNFHLMDLQHAENKYTYTYLLQLKNKKEKIRILSSLKELVYVDNVHITPTEKILY